MTDIRIDRNVAVPMRDGTVLRCDVWRPDEGERHPALLQRTPYTKELAAVDGRIGHYLTPELVAAGYAVVFQDTRGRNDSGGVWGGLTKRAWELEAHDTYDTVEWVGDQTWCTGGVGLFGASYPGALCWLGAGERPSHLRAIAPMLIGGYEEAHLDTGGGFWLHTWICWYLNGLLADLPRLRDTGAITEEQATKLAALAYDPSPIIEYLPLLDCPDFDLPGMPVTLADVLDGTATGWPPSLPIDRLQVPALLIAGYYDFYVVRMLDQFRRLRSDPVRGREHKLLVGPWTHETAGPMQGEVFLPPDATGLMSVQRAMISFFDRHLKDGADELPPVRYYVLGGNHWQSADTWPAADAHPMSWYLRSAGDAHARTGALTADRPVADELPDRYSYDPADPVWTLGGRVSSNIVGTGTGGPRDQSRLASRPDILTYRTPPLADPVVITGCPVVHLYAASSAVDTDFVAKLVDIRPDGTELLLQSGLARARYRKGVDQETPLEPGAIEKYEVTLGPISVRLPEGHRLGLYICSSDFPWYDRNMNTGHPIGADAVPVVAEQTVFHDPAYPSRVDLPTISPEPEVQHMLVDERR